MRGQRAVVGVDLGTSGVKVLVVGLSDAALGGAGLDGPGLDSPGPDGPGPDGAGIDDTVLGRGRAEYPVLVPGLGRAESDPADWWRATCRAVRQAVAHARPAEIVGVAVAGQMHGLVLAGDGPVADARGFAGGAGAGGAVAGAAVGRGGDGSLGDAVRPAILWLDQRAAVEAGRYAELPAA